MIKLYLDSIRGSKYVKDYLLLYYIATCYMEYRVSDKYYDDNICTVTINLFT